MASTWAGLNMQILKVQTALNKVTPPDPDDQFEALRTDAAKLLDKLHDYTAEHAGAGEDEE